MSNQQGRQPAAFRKEQGDALQNGRVGLQERKQGIAIADPFQEFQPSGQSRVRATPVQFFPGKQAFSLGEATLSDAGIHETGEDGFDAGDDGFTGLLADVRLHHLPPCIRAAPCGRGGFAEQTGKALRCSRAGRLQSGLGFREPPLEARLEIAKYAQFARIVWGKFLDLRFVHHLQSIFDAAQNPVIGQQGLPQIGRNDFLRYQPPHRLGLGGDLDLRVLPTVEKL